MAITKTAATIVAPGTTLAAGAASTGNSASCTGAYDVSVLVSIGNGGSAPTTACNATVYASTDNTNWFQAAFLPGSLVAGTTVSQEFSLPASTQYVRVDFSAPATNGVTIGAQLGQITAL